ncbi:MAG: hypothetical protein ACRDE8_11610 [Ginsengibacter sp.]
MRKISFCLFLCLCTLYSEAQAPDSSLTTLQGLPSKYYSKVDKKISSVNDQLTKKSLKYLAKFQRQELKLQRRLQQLNPDVAITDATQKYNELAQKIKSKTAGLSKIVSGEYNPYMDSLGTSLSFLKQFNGISDKVKDPLKSFDLLQGNLQESEKIKQFIAERKNQIKELLSKYTHLPAGLKNEYAKLNKTAWYYSAQVREYKEMLKDPDKMEKKALALLNELPAFQKFMKQNSALSGLFNLPGNYGTNQALAGLQTRDQIEQMITNRMGGGANASQLFGQQIQAAQQELQPFKDKLNKLGGGSGDIEMPDFKPQINKTKPFLARLEYGLNVQFAKNNSFVPSTANIAASVGYKINNKSVTGIGLSYLVGMGSIRHIQITSQGIGLRSYLDYRIKNQFFLSGGYEVNYNTAFKNIQQLKNYSAWQKSGLIGISKKYKVSKKINGNMQLLYDFLARTHIPNSDVILFRIGYGF